MPTPRKPTAVLKLSGSSSKHPERLKARDREPQADPTLGNVPRHLDADQKKIWAELVDQIPPCVATKSDRMIIEIAVRMVCKLRNGTIMASELSTLTRCLSQLGMTPADRSKIHVTPQDHAADAVDPFAEFTSVDASATQ
jgi:phage terminase small subunit